MGKPKNVFQNHIYLRGEIIELFDDGKVTSAKIKFDETICHLKSSKLKKLHLGDFINIESALNLDSLKQNFNYQQ
ncbi:MAG: hypothetical protein GXO87_00105 [Chlorobi bacterium]|nr:hypothetical protein [Chlorobiota bacterium]